MGHGGFKLKMAIECVKFTKYEKNTLQGFVSLRFPTTDMTIHDCTLHKKNQSRWIGLPSKKYTDENGATQYAPIVDFAETTYKAFQKQALDAVDLFLKGQK